MNSDLGCVALERPATLEKLLNQMLLMDGTPGLYVFLFFYCKSGLEVKR